MRRGSIWVGTLCALALVGCGDDDGPAMTDAGVDAGGGGGDGGRGDGGRDAGRPSMLGTCMMPQMVTGMIGTVMVDFDTTGGPPGALDFGECPETSMSPPDGPQTVVAYVVPGTGGVAIDFSLVNDQTSPDFDTVVQVRTGPCSETPVNGFPPTCFDDAGSGEYRSAGTIGAMGGDTVYFVITGYPGATTEEGPGRLEITARANAAPTLSAGDVRNFPNRLELETTGMDADGNALGVQATFLDAMGMPVDLDGSGAVDAGDDVVLAFADDLSGMMSFTGIARAMRPAMGAWVGDRIRTTMATQARLQIIDDGFALSATMMVAVRDVTEVGLGATCDASHVCASELSCDAMAMTCGADMAHATACTGATPITLALPTGSMSTGTRVMATHPATAGIFTGTCGGRGPEAIYTLTVPGTGGVPTTPVDIVLTTDVTETAMDADTVLYVRGACGDPLSEPMGACNDDIAGGMMPNYKSAVEIRNAMAQTYTIFVDSFAAPMAATAVGLSVTYRPVLATGAACDSAGLQNRCAMGACPAGAMPVCP